MEQQNFITSSKQDVTEEIPSLIKYILSSNDMAGFDTIIEGSSHHNHNQNQQMETEIPEFTSSMDEYKPINYQSVDSVSFSMPTSPLPDHLKSTKRVLFSIDNEKVLGDGAPVESLPQRIKFHSQPIPRVSAFPPLDIRPLPQHPSTKLFPPVDIRSLPQQHPSTKKLKDTRFDSFKTWSGKLERQISTIRGKPRQPELGRGNVQKAETESIRVHRYFDALQGPELETLKPSEQIVLPADRTWPFLLRYPISSFGICLGVGSQAIMWKTLATSVSTTFLHISLKVNLILWYIAVALVIIVASTYLLKTILYFEAVKREYYHPIRINFFFAPWISLLFLALSVPPSVTKYLPPALWYILMSPILCLELKIYGQWMSGGQRRLSKVANPSNHLSVVGNFVGALLGASMGLKEGPIFFFAIGLAHYTVLFVTLYQRLPTNETLPKELHPVFFLFVAAPSVASMAWAKIQGSFDYGSRVAYFIALFLYFSLAVRVNFFRGFKFSIAWWAYTFPMTGAAIATIKYSSEVNNTLTRSLAVILCTTSTLTVTALLVSTILHGFVLKDLFPNDNAIAISDRKPKHHQHHYRKWFHLRNEGADHKDIENYLKFSNSDCKDIETCSTATTSPTLGAI